MDSEERLCILGDGKYAFERVRNTTKQLRIFLEKNYYTKINQDDMNSNPNLIQNPGYIFLFYNFEI